MTIQDIKENLQNRRQRVLFRLWIAKLYNEIFFLSHQPDEVISGGWLPIYAMQGSLIGGSSADRRLRELRTIHLIPINYKIHRWKYEKRITHIYKLGCNSNEIKWYEIFNKGSQYIFINEIKNSPIVIERSGQLCLV